MQRPALAVGSAALALFLMMGPAGAQEAPSAAAADVPAAAAAAAASPAPAFVRTAQNAPAGPNLQGVYHTTFTNTFRYSAGLRLEKQNPLLYSSPPQSINLDDADRNFNAGGLTFNRLDLLSELDVANKFFGARVSGEGWYDTVYSHLNANTSPFTINQLTPQYNMFTPQARNVMGSYARLLDAFVFGNIRLGNSFLSLRVGQHALEWGDTLFLGGNGIAGTMMPLDFTKLAQIPNLQFKEYALPVEMISADLQLTPQITIGAYQQFHYAEDLFSPAGSYFAATDTFADGQRSYAGGPIFPGGPLAAMGASSDQLPPNNSFQGGLKLSFTNSAFELSLYAIQFNDKAPVTQALNFGAGAGGLPGEIGQYYFIFPQGVHAYGLSFSKTLGDFNFALETSIRTNSDLTSNGIACGQVAPPFYTPPCGDNWRNPMYATGTGLFANGNVLWQIPPNFLAKNSSMALEVAYNDRLSITANPTLLTPYATRSAAEARFVWTPVYSQIRPGVDLSIPIGMGMGLGGYTSFGQTGMHAGGVGDFEVGLSALVNQAYTITLGYTGYIGPTGMYLDPAFNLTGQQTFSDRNFLSFSISRSF